MNDSPAHLGRDVDHHVTVMIDPSGTVVALGGTGVCVFGHERDALLGRNVTAIVPPAYRSQHDAGLARAMSGGPAPAPDPFEIPVLHASGDERIAHARLHVLAHPLGPPVGALVIFATDADGNARAAGSDTTSR